MKVITLIPAPLMLLGLCGVYFFPDRISGSLKITLILSLPVLAVFSLIAFAYDALKTDMLRAFVPRLAVHLLGSLGALCFLYAVATLFVHGPLRH